MTARGLAGLQQLGNDSGEKRSCAYKHRCISGHNCGTSVFWNFFSYMTVSMSDGAKTQRTSMMTFKKLGVSIGALAVAIAVSGGATA
jgi:hypothetical protein